MTSKSSAAVSAPSETSTNPFRFEARYPAEATKIRDMSVRDLVVVLEGMKGAMDALLGLINQPRCEPDSTSHEWLEDEIDRFGAIREMMIEEFKRRPANGGCDDDKRIRQVIGYDLVECGDDVLTCLSTMSSMLAAHEQAKRDLRRAPL